MLAFTNVYFLESGLFNELEPIQVKNFSDLRRRAMGSSNALMWSHCDATKQPSNSANAKPIAQSSIFTKTMSSEKICVPAVLGSQRRRLQIAAASLCQGSRLYQAPRFVHVAPSACLRQKASLASHWAVPDI